VMSCGVGVAVADACDDLREAADIVTNTRGGRGAVRELVEQLLRAQGIWESAVRRFQTGQAS